MNGRTRFRIRHAVPADVDALVALEDASFLGDRISRRQWRRHVVGPRASVLVVVTDGQLDASALVLRRRGSRRARLYSLAVAETRRGCGVGSALLAAAEGEARRHGCDVLFLEVRSDNAAAISLYARRGFSPVERVPGYYEDGTDAWRCIKPLSDGTPLEP